jgi:uncharacterized protein YjbI with pentapeptide repeats
MAEKPDPFDVAALERSLNDSATRVSTIWISYLVFALYLLIAIGTTTHRQLFLEEPLRLPALNIDLPLYWFFLLAPILFVLLHLYVLLQVLLLGRTAAAYNEIVDRAVASAPGNALMRQRLANTLFAQIFAGSPREREGWLGRLLRAMASITLALAPIFIILAFQFVFLPYHSHVATWTHRLLLLAELVVVLLLWPLVLDPRKDFNWRKLRRRVERTAGIPFRLLSAKDQRKQEYQRLRLQAIPMAACILFVAVSLSLATFPGEPHVNLFTGNSLFTVQCHRWISQGFDRLALQGVIVADNEKRDKFKKISSASETAPSGRTRDLSCGMFDSADLRRADFVGARISGAIFDRAELQGADLRFAQLQGADLREARLQGADLRDAQLQGAIFTLAQLQGANLTHAQLQGAHLTSVQLPGALLALAGLQGADLSLAQLQGAELHLARLQGANLFMAQLQGADLRGAQLQGALLLVAQLQGADLGLAEPRLFHVKWYEEELAELGTPKGAQLQGAQLGGAQLQGANLSNSELKLAWLPNAHLWRVRHGNCSNALVTSPDFNASLSPRERTFLAATPVPATPEVIEKFIEDVVADTGNDRKSEVRERLREGLVTAIQEDDLAEIETNWRDCAANSEKIEESDYLQQHADLLRDVACNASTARKEIADGIIKNWMSDDLYGRDYTSRLARGLLGRDGKDCAATKDLSDEAKSRLYRLASTPARDN